VQLKSGASANASELIEFCKLSLASYKKPRHIFFLDDFPRNSIGKILKRDLAQLASEKLAHRR
jgi:acyl-CoA synthetase (AMP-forming)/AMP-acid ligase II